jgi:hypothetical protein
VTVTLTDGDPDVFVPDTVNSVLLLNPTRTSSTTACSPFVNVRFLDPRGLQTYDGMLLSLFNTVPSTSLVFAGLIGASQPYSKYISGVNDSAVAGQYVARVTTANGTTVSASLPALSSLPANRLFTVNSGGQPPCGKVPQLCAVMRWAC